MADIELGADGTSAFRGEDDFAWLDALVPPVGPSGVAGESAAAETGDPESDVDDGTTAVDADLGEIRELLRDVPVRISIESAMERLHRSGVRIVFRYEGALVRATTTVSSTGSLRLHFVKPDGRRTASTFHLLRNTRGVHELWVRRHDLQPDSAGTTAVEADLAEIRKLLRDVPIRISFESALERLYRPRVRFVFRYEGTLVRATTSMSSGKLLLHFTKPGGGRTSSTFNGLGRMQGVTEVWVRRHDLDMPVAGPSAGALVEESVAVSNRHAQQPNSASLDEIGEWSEEYGQWLDLESLAPEERSAAAETGELGHVRAAAVIGPDARNLFGALGSRPAPESAAE
ncbi:hypothetical protein [Nocardia lijiangensis]|uniref:hypothetical protein n=1 Tax=Nocardia lijiangensis TaxID=299618 RepID=UPI0012DCADF8|nr:hypothetical protein [Nocardia lijiangensis]